MHDITWPGVAAIALMLAFAVAYMILKNRQMRIWLDAQLVASRIAKDPAAPVIALMVAFAGTSPSWWGRLTQWVRRLFRSKWKPGDRVATIQEDGSPIMTVERIRGDLVLCSSFGGRTWGYHHSELRAAP